MSQPTSAKPLNDRAAQTLARLDDRLPVRPGPLLDLLANDGQQPQQVTAIIERDPAMSARVLGVVNSAGNRRLNEVTTVKRAVLQLGAGPVRTLGLAMGLQGFAEQLGLPDEWLRGFWNASLHKAEAAHLAAMVVDPACKDAAYCAGLIADLGLPLLVALDPTFYADRLPLRAADQTWSDAERRHFGIDHAGVGAHVLRRWNVAASTARRVEDHHRLPDEGEGAGLALALYAAGLLPHDDGEIDPADLDRLIAVHGRVLGSAYASPDAFLGHVYAESQRRMGRDVPRDHGDGLLPQPFLDAVSANTIHLVTQLCELKDTRSRQREDLGNLRFEAFTDPLTKALNRRGFFTLAQQRLAKYPQGVSAACMVLDLNDFKPVNDRFGHDAGDLVLRGLAKLMRRALARHDLIGRLGGDEFAVLLVDVDEHAARVAAARLRDTCLGTQIRVTAEHTVTLSFSLGVVHHPCVGPDVKLEQLLSASDEVMYRRKRSGTPGVIFSALTGKADPADGPT